MGGKKNKRKSSTAAGVVATILKAPAALAFLWPVLLVTGGYFAWHRWGANAINQKYNSLDINQVEISTPPDYIRSEVVKAVFEATDLTKVSLLDVQATAQIANAFATSPWIESVRRVQKNASGGVDVQVTYRRPVAMVRVNSRHPEVEGTSFFPVDRAGVLLPTDDFSRADTSKYVHIMVEDTYPISGVGSSFGDTRVNDAAMLAAILVPHRNQLGLQAITIAQRPPHDDRPSMLNLVTSNGRQIIWGSAPGKEMSNEPQAAIKLQTLLNDPTVKALNLHLAQPSPISRR